MRAPEGQMLAQYRLLEKIGEGGMGIVYKALDTKLRRHIAIKVLAADLTGEPEQRRRFMREARSAAAVKHPNIATIHEVDEVDGVAFLAMELVEGETLRTLLRRERLPIPRVLDLATRIADGLARAHRSRVVHRDLKPENVMIEADGQPKILDFGLAKVLEVRHMAVSNLEEPETETRQTNLTQRGDIMGTVAYMSPEQAQGEMVDARSDIFSFGIMLYEMVAGRLPFKGKTPMDTLAAIIKSEAIPTSRLNPSVPPALDRVIKKCLEKDLRRRFQTAEAALAELKSCEPVTPFVVRLARVARRKWALILLVVLALASALAGPSLIDRLPGGPGRSNTVIDTIAVLPMVNLSGDPEQEYFADGMTAALITNLSKLGGLKVISRTSTMRYKDSDKSLPQIAQDLGVEGVIEGSVMRVGDRVRITAQLVDAATDGPLWGEEYERDLRDILILQGEIAHTIAKEIRVTLTPDEKTRLTATQSVDPEAYEAYLKGQNIRSSVSMQNLRQAVSYFERAIEIAPLYAPAHAGLAGCYGGLTFIGELPPSIGRPRQKAGALRALELDPTLAEAHMLLGTVSHYYEWDWTEAEMHFRRAIELEPGNAELRVRYVWFLIARRKLDEALVEARRAKDLDPLSVAANLVVGQALFYLQRYVEAEQHLRLMLTSWPDPFPLHTVLSDVYIHQKRFNRAITELEIASNISEGRPGWPVVTVGLTRAHALAGDRQKAVEILGRVQSRGASVPSYNLALAYLALGDTDQALRYLQQAYEERDGWMPYLKVNPDWDPLRSHPAFRELVRRVGI